MDNGTTFGEGSWIFGLIVLLGLFGGFNGGFGANNNAALAGYATMADVNAAINNQSIQNSLNSALLSSNNNNYETAQLINNQTAAMMATQNNNLVNAIQGYNQISSNLQGGFANVSAQIADLGYKMENCCCSIKTMLLEQRLQDAQQALADSRNVAVNQAQSEFLLNTMGKWVANAPAAAAYTVAK